MERRMKARRVARHSLTRLIRQDAEACEIVRPPQAETVAAFQPAPSHDGWQNVRQLTRGQSLSVSRHYFYDRS